MPRIFFSSIAHALIAIVFLGGGAWAQSRAETLGDIRQALSLLRVEIDALRAENQPTGGGDVNLPPGMFERMEQFQIEIARLTDLTERLEFRISRIVRDGSNRLGDLAFQLCELDPNCALDDIDLSPRPLGEGALSEQTNSTATLEQTFDAQSNQGEAENQQSEPSEPEPARPAINEREARIDRQEEVQISPAELQRVNFERAKAVFDAGNYATAAQLFAAFLQKHQTSPRRIEAYFLSAQSHSELEEWKQAGEAYLKGFEKDPDSPFAPKNLLGLGFALGKLGHWDDACTIIGEVSSRYPRSDSAIKAKKDFVFYNCF